MDNLNIRDYVNVEKLHDDIVKGTNMGMSLIDGVGDRYILYHYMASELVLALMEEHLKIYGGGLKK